MANNVNNHNKRDKKNLKKTLDWDANRLAFVVREPFRSKMSQTNIGFGMISTQQKLKIESQMPVKGVIFSDGIEADFLNFNSGSIVEIGIADEKANLIL